MKPYRVRIEFAKTSPEKINVTESANPHISWAIASGSETQSARRVNDACAADVCDVIAHDNNTRVIVAHEGRPFWDTGWVNAAGQNVKYSGNPLTEGEVYDLSVQLRGSNGEESPPEHVRFCPGQLSHWPAKWLCEKDAREDAVVSFFRDIDLPADAAAACLFVSGLGYHKIYVNGQCVFDDPLNPAFSEYDKRCYYQVLPGIENFLRGGKNRLGVRVAAGWRSPANVCYQLNKCTADFAGPTQMSAALRVRYSNGRIEWFISDEQWQYFYDPVVYSNIFMGERYEAAKCLPDWSVPGRTIENCYSAIETSASCGKMTPQTLEPVCCREMYPAISVVREASADIVDFGQNIAGVCRIRIPRNAAPGQVIEILHAEILDEDGRLFTAPLRRAKSVDTYVAAGNGKDPEFWQPEFTYHGFRYAEVRGLADPLLKEDITAIALYTDIAFYPT